MVSVFDYAAKLIKNIIGCTFTALSILYTVVQSVAQRLRVKCSDRGVLESSSLGV